MRRAPVSRLSIVSRTSWADADTALRCADLASSLFINTALMLWAFDIAQDPARPIDPDALTDGANVFPLPFAVTFTPRVDKLEELLGHEEI